MKNNISNQKIDDMFSELEVGSNEKVQEKSKIELPEKETSTFEQVPVNIDKPELKSKADIKPKKLKSVPTPSVQATEISKLHKDVESILEQNLSQIYYNIPTDKQAEFKKAGEETAKKISELLSGVKVKANKVFKLIVKWLKMIPGINKHYLEQEAKIKTDKLLELRNKNI